MRHAHGADWSVGLPAGLLGFMRKWRTYDTSSGRDCIRFFRNYLHHLHEIPMQDRFANDVVEVNR